MNILERILFFFGLVTYKRAKHFNEELLATRERCIMEDANKDFGVGAIDGFERTVRFWANESFEHVITKPMGAVVADKEWEQGYLSGFNPRVSVISRANKTIIRI